MPDAPAPVLRLPRFWRLLVRLTAFVLALGLVELVASRMERMSPVPERVSWAARVIREGGDPFLYRAHPYTLYRPTSDYVGWTGQRQHNRLGFRGGEVALPKPPGTWRIVCLGDSTTYGVSVEDPAESYPAQMEQFLRKETGRRTIEVVNAGFPGATSAEVLQTLVFRLWPLEPDVVILNAGINDSLVLLAPGYRDDYAHYKQPFVLPHYSAATRALLWSPSFRMVFSRLILRGNLTFWGWLVESGPTADWQLREPVAYAANTESAALVGRVRGARTLLVTPKVDLENPGITPLWAETVRRLAAAAAQVAQRRGVPLCRFDEQPLPRDAWSDHVHLRASGERLKAEFVGRDLIKHGLVPPAGPADSRPGNEGSDP